MVCSDWMHSKHKVHRQFPMVNETMIQKLYGLGIPADAKKSWLFKACLQTLNLENIRYISYLIKFFHKNFGFCKRMKDAMPREHKNQIEKGNRVINVHHNK